MKFSAFVFLVAFLFVINFSQSQNSVLSGGDWYKIAVDQTGIFQIGYEDLENYGIDPAQINPKHIKLFGNGNGMLPEPNSAFRYNDPQENSIFVYGEDDESFDPGDYILFYGENPTDWNLNEETNQFEHTINLYSDYTYYLLTIGTEVGKRIENIAEPPGTPTQTVTQFNAYYQHEIETYNLTKSGKTWYGELFEGNSTHDFDLNLSELISDIPIHLRSTFAVRSFENSTMEISVNGAPVSSVVLTSVNPNSTKYAQKKTDNVSFTTDNPEFTLSYTYNQVADSSQAWLDFFEINYHGNLSFTENQFNFRETSSVGQDNITLFTINNADASTAVWNVTDPINITSINGMPIGDVYEFKIETDSLLEFIAFKGMEFPNPEFIGQVENQNLHGYDPVDLIIVTPPEFLEPANQLGQFHETNDGFSWLAVTPDQIYNEFSSGAMDITAIRDFVRYMYLNSGEQKPQYLLLFGDGSYDPKDRIENNLNFVPTFQLNESLIMSSSYVVDDYFGFLDEDEGNDAVGNLDIGIGRIPANSTTEASAFVSKIIHYSTNNSTFGNWKNEVCLVADDGDGNLHQDQADSLSGYLQNYNTDKLYFDFFELVQTPEGPRYPAVNEKIEEHMQNGVFMMNYTGHGGNEGWGHEKVLVKEDINGWNNFNYMPIMIVGSCEFGRFDNPEEISSGELAVIKNDGGVIGIFNSTRLAYSQSNFAMTNRLFEYFNNPDIEVKRLGDLIKYSKPPGQLTTRNFVLLGDPALKISTPKYFVQTETVNGINVGQPMDTINPGTEISITGILKDFDGNSIPGFNGDMNIKVFERPYIKTTLGNDPNSFPTEIVVQDSVLLEMQSTVENGEFEFSFILPSDMNQDYGNIRISYYASNENEDASGNYTDIVVGGEPNSIFEHQEGNEFFIYPTLVSASITIKNKGNGSSIKAEIIDLSGKTLQSYSFKNIKKQEDCILNVSNLSKGFYLLKISSDNGISDHKFIKK